MKRTPCSRREAIRRSGLLMGTALVAGSYSSAKAASESARSDPGAGFTYCLNTGTIRGHKLGLTKEIEVAAKAGFQAIEPWTAAIDQYAKSGGSLPDLRKRISDLGITVEGAIGFAQWIIDDDAQRAKGLERLKYEMDLVAQIGGKRIATPPAGATETPNFSLLKAAERYRAILELGDRMNVTPQLELWGFSKNLHLLGECAYVAIETGHPRASILADVFHMYKGQTPFGGLRMLHSSVLQMFHINDYPAEPPRAQINDSFRVMPGDGVAPLDQILRDLQANGGNKVLSLELFNAEYYKKDALEVAKLGIEKMKAAVNRALKS